MNFKYEEMDLLKRFVPYSKGTPSKAHSYDDQYDRANIVFFSDSHVDFFEKEACIENVEYTIDFINSSPVKFDAVVHTGDVITPFGIHEKDDALKRAEPFFKAVEKCTAPFIFSKGNHDLNDWDNYPDQVLNDSDWGKLVLDRTEEAFGMIRQTKANGKKSTWHYYDIEKHKIRIVALDAQDTDKETAENGTVKYHGGKSFYISNEQMNWIVNTALDFDDKEEKNWGVIFTLHQIAQDNALHESATDKLLKICQAFNEGDVCNIDYTNENPFFNLHVKADFTRYKSLEKKPCMICWLIGHNHTDKNEVRNGINLIWTINNSATTVSSDARVARVIGTSTQNAFDILNVDTLHRKIRIFRYGAGLNCYGQGGDRFLPDGIDY